MYISKIGSNNAFSYPGSNATSGISSEKEITFTGSKQEMEQKVNAAVEQGCQRYGIPPELKPDVKVEDMLQYETPQEINAKINSNTKDIFENSSKSPQEMTQKEFEQHLNKNTDLSKKEIQEISNPGNGKDKGFYVPANNTITYYAQDYRNGNDTIESTIFHELYHTKEAIARSSLSQQSRDEIVKNELLSSLRRGESGQVFKQFPQNNDISSVMTEVPLFDSVSGNEFATLAEESLFTDDWSFYEKMKRYTELLEQENPNEAELMQAKNELGDFAYKIDELAKNGKIGKSYSLCLSQKDKTRLLMNYAMSVEFRYQYFRQKEIKNKNIPVNDSEENKKLAQQSFKSHIDSTQANYALTIARQQDNKRNSRKVYQQYYTSREEVQARMASEKNEIKYLENQNKLARENHDRDLTKSTQKQISDKKIQYKSDKVYNDFHKAEDKLESDPYNVLNHLNYINNKQRVYVQDAINNTGCNSLSAVPVIGSPLLNGLK